MIIDDAPEKSPDKQDRADRWPPPGPGARETHPDLQPPDRAGTASPGAPPPSRNRSPCCAPRSPRTHEIRQKIDTGAGLSWPTPPRSTRCSTACAPMPSMPCATGMGYSAWRCRGGDRRCGLHGHEAGPGRYVKISVSDTGHGIPKEHPGPRLRALFHNQETREGLAWACRWSTAS